MLIFHLLALYKNRLYICMYILKSLYVKYHFVIQSKIFISVYFKNFYFPLEAGSIVYSLFWTVFCCGIKFKFLCWSIYVSFICIVWYVYMYVYCCIYRLNIWVCLVVYYSVLLLGLGFLFAFLFYIVYVYILYILQICYSMTMKK